MNVFAAKDFQQATTQGHAPQQQQQQLTLAASTKKRRKKAKKEMKKRAQNHQQGHSAQLNSTKSLICENASVWEKSLSSNIPKPNRAELN